LFSLLFIALIVFPLFYAMIAEEGLLKMYANNGSYILLLVCVGAWLLYTILFYQMKNTDGSLFAPGGWMLSGYKRGMFSFVPLAVFYCAANEVCQKIYARVENLAW
jgi:Mg2+/citrate symporter